MITTMPAPFREPEDRTLKWVMIFILLSLLLHALLLIGIVLVSHLVPPPNLTTPEPPEAKINLTFLPPPPVPQKKIFIPTQPQQNVPHKEQRVESANDTELRSQSKVARDNSAIMPDIIGKPHAPDQRNSPAVKAQKQPQATSQPTPRQNQVQKPIPNPKPQMSPEMQPRPLPPQPKPAPPKAKPEPAQPQVDPDTGLPVLPPITAQTMAPPDQSRPLAPQPSQQQVAGSVHGALGRSGDTSPAAMASDLGKYKQYIYEVVGSYWYPQVDKEFGAIGVGSVTIRFTIHSDGTMSDVQVVDGETNQILKTISQNALTSPAPFKPFSAAMIKEVGDSYSDDFSFSTY